MAKKILDSFQAESDCHQDYSQLVVIKLSHMRAIKSEARRRGFECEIAKKIDTEYGLVTLTPLDEKEDSDEENADDTMAITFASYVWSLVGWVALSLVGAMVCVNWK